MAPKDLLRQIFKHAHAKATSAAHASEDRKPLTSAKAEGDILRPRTPGNEKYSPASSLYTIGEDGSLDGSEVSEDAAESMPMPSEYRDAGPLNTAHAAALDHSASLLAQTADMTSSHLDTIDTALVLLEALGHMSPHVAALRYEIVEKRKWCAEELEKLKAQQRDLLRGQLGRQEQDHFEVPFHH
ncbi:hypothetical protein BDV95DRAFT_606495 [Massariosphaeria phaeospora]|uniref:Uncharacterized protein n=1 Tax=Massariosphaeria phaeospora TaxID=100035 RepID=A0A7C8I8E9_9PLEO|nr:hypothetical protein BDV95DRAFT_606495 [Massariosphaeria phaeospora]